MSRRRLLFSARTRVVAALVVLLALSTAASTIALRQVLLARADERVDAALTQEVGEFRRLVRDGRDPRDGTPFGRNLLAIFDVFISRNVPGEQEVIYTFLGDRLHRSSRGREPDRDVLAALLAADRGATVRADVDSREGTVRYLSVPVVLEGEVRGTFVTTASLGRERQEVNEAVRVALTVSLIVLLAACGLAWLVAGRVLRPLRQLRDTARSITETDLTRRIEVEGDDELAELGRTFNAMLDRLEEAFAVQRQFVSDAGHELRTPITIVRGHLELLGDDPAERRETIALVTDELDRMSRFVDDLLTLAKAERGDFLHLEDLDLDVLTEELVAKSRALDGDRVWAVDRVTPGLIRGDRQRLTQAAMNLARNAVEHTGPGDAIWIGSSLTDGEARLWVR
ncbi:MAG TPA: HAMP domain-containing protein, partial [Capillimicrobium sp.]